MPSSYKSKSNNAYCKHFTTLFTVAFLIIGCKPESNKIDYESLNIPQESEQKDISYQEAAFNPEITKKNNKIESNTHQIPSSITTQPSEFVFTNIKNVYVVDGDTIHGLNNQNEKIKVRLAAIDAPESDQVLGEQSAKSLRECIGSSNDVTLMYKENDAIDRYNRLVATVHSNMIDCNLLQVERGMAWFYEQYEDAVPAENALNLSNAQQYAKSQSSGIWQQDTMPAWEYRHSQ